MAMASTTSINGINSGLQIGRNSGPIIAQFNTGWLRRSDGRGICTKSLFFVLEQFEISENRACLRDLQTTDPRHDKKRIETVKGGLMDDAYNWILDHADFKAWRYEQQSQLLWIKGNPGKGKTMLLCGIIDELTKSAPKTTAISFFFCQATDVRTNHAIVVLRGLIFMLVDQQPSLISYVRRQYDKNGKQVFEDDNAWEALSEILTNILEDPLLQATTTYLIIDALDECTSGLDRLLELVAQKSSAYQHVKWIVSSRNWPAIEETLDAMSQKTKLSLELNETSVAKAVAVFIHYKVQKLTEKKKYGKEICDAVSQHLLSNAHGTFLWVALVCEKLTRVPKRNVLKKLQDFPSGLDQLYRRMLNQLNDEDDKDEARLYKSLLGIIMTVYRPITLDELASCIDLPNDVTDDHELLKEIIGLCGSFLTFRGRMVSLVHQSAKDFLLREAVQEIFPNGEDKVHYSIFSKSLEAISRTLRRDIYSLVHPGYPIDQVNQPDPDPLAAIRYACVYWVNHLSECSSSKNTIQDLRDNDSIGNFFANDYLHWLEALSLSRSLSEGIASMLKLESLLQVCFH
jgi:nucleoside-triphosphatase THEP1